MARRSRFLRTRKPTSARIVRPALWLAAGFAVLLAGAAAIGIAAGLYIYDDYSSDFEPPEDVAVNQRHDGAKVYDRNGEFLYEFVDQLNGLRRPVQFDEISPYMIAATVATEDSTFFENSGLNVRGLARAALENFNPFAEGEVLDGSGGSSISQQLAKNLYIPEEERMERSINRKIREAVYALELTREYSKEQIITWYLNQISYGGIYYGVQAASEGYFGKPASELTLAEAALLAGIPQSPSAYEPISRPEASKARRDQVLELMRDNRIIEVGNGETLTVTDAEIEAAKAEVVEVAPRSFALNAPHFVFSQVRPQLEAIFGREALLEDGLQVTTTLDMNLQRAAEEALERWIVEFEDISNSRNGAVIVIHPWTGEILTYIGSRDYYREDIEGKNDNLMSLNSPGSSFKPFIYLTAFMELGWSPGTILVDERTQFREDDGTIFEPTNPVDRYHGRITIRDALGNSLNIPPFKTAVAVGVDKIVQNAKNIGFSTLEGDYGPAIAIGGVDLTALELAYGYAMLANGGVIRGITINPEVSDEIGPVAVLTVHDRSGREVYRSEDHAVERRVTSEEHAFMISSILSDPRSQCVTFGCGGLNVPGKNVAVKTGTSEPFDPKGPNAGRIGETWAFGYTRDYVVAIWAGNSDNAPITNIYSTSISFRSMRDIILAAYGDQAQTPFVDPPNIAFSSGCSTAGVAVGCRVDLVVRNSGHPERPEAAAQNRIEQQRQEEERQRQEAEQRAQQQQQQQQAQANNGPGSSGNIVAAISSPAGGAVSGSVAITGSATSPSFTSYTIEIRGAGGRSAVVSSHEPRNGALATWSTAGWPSGTYSVTLTVHDAVHGSASSTVTVTVP